MMFMFYKPPQASCFIAFRRGHLTNSTKPHLIYYYWKTGALAYSRWAKQNNTVDIIFRLLTRIRELKNYNIIYQIHLRSLRSNQNQIKSSPITPSIYMFKSAIFFLLFLTGNVPSNQIAIWPCVLVGSSYLVECTPVVGSDDTVYVGRCVRLHAHVKYNCIYLLETPFLFSLSLSLSLSLYIYIYIFIFIYS